MRGRSQLARDQRGVALVEFALVLPLFLTLLFAIAQFAIVFNQYLTLTDAVRAGARAASVSRSADAGRIATQQAAGNLDLTGRIDVSAGPGWQRGADVTVTATYPYDIDVLGIVIASGDLESTTTERVE